MMTGVLVKWHWRRYRRHHMHNNDQEKKASDTRDDAVKICPDILP